MHQWQYFNYKIINCQSTEQRTNSSTKLMVVVDVPSTSSLLSTSTSSWSSTLSTHHIKTCWINRSINRGMGGRRKEEQEEDGWWAIGRCRPSIWEDEHTQLWNVCLNAILSCSWCYFVWFCPFLKNLTCVWPTDGPKDGPTDGWTDTPSYRDARTHLKSWFCCKLSFYDEYNIKHKPQMYQIGIILWLNVEYSDLQILFKIDLFMFWPISWYRVEQKEKEFLI